MTAVSGPDSPEIIFSQAPGLLIRARKRDSPRRVENLKGPAWHSHAVLPLNAWTPP